MFFCQELTRVRMSSLCFACTGAETWLFGVGLYWSALHIETIFLVAQVMSVLLHQSEDSLLLWIYRRVLRLVGTTYYIYIYLVQHTLYRLQATCHGQTVQTGQGQTGQSIQPAPTPTSKDILRSRSLGAWNFSALLRTMQLGQLSFVWVSFALQIQRH